HGRDARRAGGGGKEAARGQQAEGGAVQRGVSVERGGHGLLRLRECRRVEDDQIEALLLLAQVLEHVGGDEAVLFGRKPIQLEVFSSELNRGGVAIDLDPLSRPGGSGRG